MARNATQLDVALVAIEADVRWLMEQVTTLTTALDEANTALASSTNELNKLRAAWSQLGEGRVSNLETGADALALQARLTVDERRELRWLTQERRRSR